MGKEVQRLGDWAIITLHLSASVGITPGKENPWLLRALTLAGYEQEGAHISYFCPIYCKHNYQKKCIETMFEVNSKNIYILVLIKYLLCNAEWI